MTLGSWLAALQALLPPGRAFTREAGATITRVLEAIAAMLLAAQLRLEALLMEWDPRVATTMLPDWERVLGLPDECAPTATLSIAERQRLAYQRLLEQGGQSRAYFIALAEQLGEPGVTIDEFRQFNCGGDCNGSIFGTGDVFTWRVNIPHEAQNARLMNCNDDCGDGLQFYKPSLAECPIQDRKPAHTDVIFAYGDQHVSAWVAAVDSAGGTYDPDMLPAMIAFCQTLKANGVWDKIDRLNLFAGLDLAAALVPLKVGAGAAVDANVNFVAGDYASANGLTGNGVDKRIDTGLSILTLDKADFGMGVWARTNALEAVRRADIGSSYVATGATDRFYMHTEFNGGLGDAGLGINLAATWAGVTGLLAMESTGATALSTWKNGVTAGSTNAWNNDGFQAGTVTVFNGGGNFHSNHTLAGYYVGRNLDQAQLTAAWAAFNAAIGR